MRDIVRLMPRKTTLKQIGVNAQKEAIRAAIAKHGSKAAAARALGTSPQNIHLLLTAK